jgi:hypothetical protein
MYPVEVEVVLSGRDGLMGLSRRVGLPFPPTLGLGLYGLTAHPDRAETVGDVGWDVVGGFFRVELVGCQSVEWTLSELIDGYGPGWELHEPGTEPVEDP